MKLKSLILLFVMQFFLSFFVSSQEVSEKLRVGVLNGPSCVPCANLMDEDSYEFTKFADPQALLPKMIKNEIDIGFLPVNVAVKVYNTSNHKLICCAVTGNGNLKLLTTKENIKRISDLTGCSVNVAGQGATPEYVFQYLLKKNKIELGGKNAVKMDFSIPTAQIPAMLISGKIDYAILPEPFATIACMKSKSVFAPVDIQKEYSYFSGKETFPLTVMVVRSDYAYSHRQEVETFLKAYEKAVKETLNNPGKTGELCEKHNLGLSKALVTKAIPKSNYVYVKAEDSVDQIESLLKIFIESNSASVGGFLPDSDFYYHGEIDSQ
ncbi:MAG: ABC transporter substrate-binding protein [Treponema sp.]|nr:ABC transporter substrate-binding protein [Treponema sp.]